MIKYRREIDGLRAVAVLPVILFHAGFKLFSGGYVGVDVFFVISGFLITTIIFTERLEGKFSIVNFYERRVRRILPALFFVLICTIPFALILPPTYLVSFADSVIAVCIYMSNILFWKEAGYFDITAELKPLLHTWSLAVEEQFYLFFPIFVAIFWKVRRLWIFAAIGAVAICSLILAQWAVFHKPMAAFYLLPTRAWELMAGALAASWFIFGANSRYRLLVDSYTKRFKYPNFIRELLAILGLGMIVFSVFFFNKSTPFPGINALLPVMGTVLVILFASDTTITGKLLGLKGFVGIGLISYSAYLWHQPLLAFSSLYHLDNADTLRTLFLVLLVLPLSWFTWRFVEQPFRNKSLFSRKIVFRLSFVMTALLIAFGVVVHGNNGFEARYNVADKKLLEFMHYDAKTIYREGRCFLRPEQTFKDFSDECHFVAGSDRKNEILIWGDSHAAAVSVGVRKISSNVAQFTTSACPPIVGVDFAARPNCEKINEYVLAEIGYTKPKYIVLHANWLLNDSPEMRRGFVATIKKIGLLSPDTQTFVLGGGAQWTYPLPILLQQKAGRVDVEASLYTSLLTKLHALDGVYSGLLFTVEHINQKNNPRFISLIDFLCKADECKSIVGNQPLVWDTGHLTESGSDYLAKKYLSDIFIEKEKF